jgi:hypothetical protein
VLDFPLLACVQVQRGLLSYIIITLSYFHTTIKKFETSDFKSLFVLQYGENRIATFLLVPMRKYECSKASSFTTQVSVSFPIKVPGVGLHCFICEEGFRGFLTRITYSIDSFELEAFNCRLA